MLAREFMTTKLVTCSPSQIVADAAELMAKNDFSIMPVVDSNGILQGIITESDFIGKEVEIPHALVSMNQLFGHSFHLEDVEPIYAEAKSKKLSEVMTKNPITVNPDTTLTSIIELMIAKNLKRLPVVENKKLVGIITRQDLIRAFNLVK